MLIFEETTSALYYSNDARLHVRRAPSDDTAFEIVRVPDEPVVDYTRGEVVFVTRDRVKADAYIAGYDLATGS